MVEESQVYLFFLITFVIVPILIGAILCSILIPIHIRNNKYRRFVREHNKAFLQLMQINSGYKFATIYNHDLKHSYDNVNFYNDISCKDYLIYHLNTYQKSVLKTINDALNNKSLFEKYIDDVKGLKGFKEYNIEIGKYKIKKLNKTAKEEIKKSLFNPVTSFTISVLLTLTNINGERKARKIGWFDSDQIKKLIYRINQKNGDFYNDRYIWDAICRVERGKVTNKLRFLIYQRDGYRCCMCGRRGNGNNLEIDHIFPISKGGKTKIDNLQTLCHRCNILKGDSVQ